MSALDKAMTAIKEKAVTTLISDIDADLADLDARRQALVEARTALAGLIGDTPATPAAAEGAVRRSARTPKKRKRKSPDQGGPVDCPDCGKQVKTAAGLGPHKRSCPGKTAPTVPPPAASVPAPALEVVHDDGYYVCGVCDEEFLTRGNLAAHRRRENHYTPEQLAEESAS